MALYKHWGFLSQIDSGAFNEDLSRGAILPLLTSIAVLAVDGKSVLRMAKVVRRPRGASGFG
jgi:hypothetical protein